MLLAQLSPHEYVLADQLPAVLAEVDARVSCASQPLPLSVHSMLPVRLAPAPRCVQELALRG